MASAAHLRLVHGFAEPRIAVADAPPVVASEPLVGAPPPRSDRFWIAAAVSLLLHGGIVAAWSGWSVSDEARSEGGSEDFIVIEGASVVLLDSMPSAGATGLPEAEPLTEAAPASSALAETSAPTPVTEAEATEIVETPQMEIAALDAVPMAEPLAKEVPVIAEAMPQPEPVETAPVEAVAEAQPVEVAVLDAEPVVETVADAVPVVSETVYMPAPVVEAIADPVATAEVPVADAAPVTADAPPAQATVADAEPVMEAAAVTAALVAEVPVAIDGDVAVRDAESVATVEATPPQIEEAKVALERPAEPVRTSDDAAPADTVTEVTPSLTAKEVSPVADTLTADVSTAAADTARPVETAEATAAEDRAVEAAEVPVETATVETVAVPPMPRPAPPAPAKPVPPETKTVKIPPAAEKQQKAASRASPARPASQAQPTAQSRDPGKVGGGGRSSTETGRQALSSYQAKVAAHLRRHRAFPADARRTGARGTAVVRFTVNRSGRVVGASLARSSGNSVLDNAAIAMVRRASPFPAMPSSVGGNSVTVSAPLRFDFR